MDINPKAFGLNIKTRYVLPQKVPNTIDKALSEIIKSPIVRQILYNRGIDNTDLLIKQHFTPINLAHYLLYNTAQASDKIIAHIKKGSKIIIYGDYDADGILATATLWDFIYRELEYKNVNIYIPSRIEEGYGLNNNALEKLAKQGTNLVITVDCGITSGKLVQTWQKQGLDFIITDHHTPPEKWPNTTFVHPAHPKSKLDTTQTSGTHVAFRLAYDTAYKLNLNTDKIFYKYIDLVAISLITDVMPLVGENKTIVKEGLHKLNTKPPTWIKILYKTAYPTAEQIKFTEQTLGFIIGPRLNAAGRLEDPKDALRLVATNSTSLITRLAKKLDTTNRLRQELTQEQTKLALKKLHIVSKKLAIAYDSNFNEGIIGLIAGKIAQYLNVPTIVITNGSNGNLKGSARSPKNFHITKFLAYFEDIMENFGGHSQAAGFTSNTTDINKFINFATNIINKYYADYIPENITYIDAIISSQKELYNFTELSNLAPFGQANPKPNLLLKDFIKEVYTDKNNLHTFINTHTGIKAIFWNNTNIAKLNINAKQALLALGELRPNNLYDSIEFIINRLVKSNELTEL